MDSKSLTKSWQSEIWSRKFAENFEREETMQAILKLFLSISILTALPFVISSAEADDAIIFASCKKDLQLSESACQCVLSEVHDNLKPNQLEMFMAMIQGDGAAIAQAQSSGKMSGNDMMLLTNFMATTPTKCQNK